MSEGIWPSDSLHRAFVEGAAWWENHCHGGTMWRRDRDLAELEALKRYGELKELGKDEHDAFEEDMK